MNSKNLKPFSKRSVSEARESGKKGGIASGKIRRERKALKELLEIALETPRCDGKSTGEAVVASLIDAALNGDTKAFIAIRDTVGEKPVEKKEDQITGTFSIVWGEKNA